MISCTYRGISCAQWGKKSYLVPVLFMLFVCPSARQPTAEGGRAAASSGGRTREAKAGGGQGETA